MTDDASSPRKLPLILAILLGLSSAPCALSSLVLIYGGDAVSVFREMGWVAWPIVLALGASTLAVSVIGGARAAGRTLPWSVATVTSASPWLAGLVGENIGLGQVRDLLLHADQADHTRLMAIGLSEVANASAVGAWLSAGLFGSLALIASIVTRREPTKERKMGGAILAAPVLAGLFVCVALTVLTGGVRGLGAMVGFLLASVTALVALSVSGAAVGPSTSGRLGSATLAAALASLGTIVFAGVATLGHAESRALGGIAHEDRAHGWLWVADGLIAHFAAQWSLYALGFAALLAFVGAVGLVRKRAAASRGAYIDASVTLALFLGLCGIGLGSHLRRTSITDEFVATLPDDAIALDPDGIGRTGAPRTAYDAGLAALAEVVGAEPEGLSFVLDEQVTGAQLTQTLLAAQSAGASSVSIFAHSARVRDSGLPRWRTPAVLEAVLWAPTQATLQLCERGGVPTRLRGMVTAEAGRTEIEITRRDTGERERSHESSDPVEVSFAPTPLAADLAAALDELSDGSGGTRAVFCPSE